MLSLYSLKEAWNKFFFEPKPTEGIAIFRIVWCFILFAYFLLDIGNIDDFYGPDSILSLEAVKTRFNYPHIGLFSIFGDSYQTVYFIFCVYSFALICSILGFFTRTNLIIAFICMASLHQRNIWLLSSSELLMRTIMILLVCSPCGHSLSIDSFLGRRFKFFRKKRNWAPWALRLIQLQVSVVYIWTVWHKLKGDSWIDGTAVYYATRLDSMANFTVPFILDSLPLIRLLTWGTLIIELAMGTLIWIKEFRKPVILFGILFHLGIEYTMSIPFFEIIMMALLLNFVTPTEYKVLVVNVRKYLRHLMSTTVNIEQEAKR